MSKKRLKLVMFCLSNKKFLDFICASNELPPFLNKIPLW